MTAGFGKFAAYITGQMAAGRLRPVRPLLALQSFVGPLFLHLLTREFAERRVGLALPLEEAATELAETWLRAMEGEKSHG